MGRMSTCQKNSNTIDLRRAQVNDDSDGDGDGDGDDDPCKNALTAPEPLLASAHTFSNSSTLLVLNNT